MRQQIGGAQADLKHRRQARIVLRRRHRPFDCGIQGAVAADHHHAVGPPRQFATPAHRVFTRIAHVHLGFPAMLLQGGSDLPRSVWADAAAGPRVCKQGNAHANG